MHGYNKAKGQGSNNDYSNKTPLDEFYFYKAVHSHNNQDKIYYYSKAIKIEPNYSIAYLGRAMVYADLERYNDAIADYTRLTKIDPDYGAVYDFRGRAYYQLGKYNDAVDDFTKSIGIDPNYASQFHSRGRAYYDLGKYNEAVIDFTKSISIGPNNPQTYFYRAFASIMIARQYPNEKNIFITRTIDACDDWKRLCDLGDEMSCEAYKNECAGGNWGDMIETCIAWKRGCDLGKKTSCREYDDYCTY